MNNYRDEPANLTMKGAIIYGGYLSSFKLLKDDECGTLKYVWTWLVLFVSFQINSNFTISTILQSLHMQENIERNF